jgi:hypothetical protein
MVRQNERFRLPLSGQLCYLVQAWIDRFTSRPVTLPAFSPSLAEQMSVAAKKGTSLAVEKEPVVGLRYGLHAGGLRVPSRRACEATPLELPYANFRCPAATGRSVWLPSKSSEAFLSFPKWAT